MQLPKVDIVTVNYNSMRFIKDYLTSLKALNYPLENLKIYFIDNDSKDKSIDYVKRNKGNLNIEFIKNNRNYGFAKGNNIAFERCNGYYIMLLNVDTKICENCLINLVKKMQEDNRIGICEAKQEPLPGNKFYDPITFETPSCSGSGMLIRKEALDEVGWFDEVFFMYYEDTDLSLRMWLKNWKCIYVPSAICHHWPAHLSNKRNTLKRNYYSYKNMLLMGIIYRDLEGLVKLYLYFLNEIMRNSYHIRAKKFFSLILSFFGHFFFLHHFIKRRKNSIDQSNFWVTKCKLYFEEKLD